MTFLPTRLIREPLTERALKARAVGGSLIAILLWVVLTYGGFIRADFLPTPGSVLSSLWYLHTEQALVRSALWSLFRVLMGFLVSLGVAFPLGVLCGGIPRIRAWVLPTLEPFRVLPIAGILPLTILWCGIGETQKIAALFLGTVFFLVVAIASSIESVEGTYLSLASTLGATGWQKIWKVLIPAAGPSIWEASRNLYGVAFSYLLIAEAVAAEYGLGALTIAAQRRQHVDQVFALILVILLLGYASDALLKLLGRKIFPWADLPQ